MKRITKLFAVLLTVGLLCGIIAVVAGAAPYAVSSENQLVIPAVKEDGVLVSGNYAYNDGTSTSGWAQGNGGSSTYTTWGTSKGYFNLRQNLAKTTPGSASAPYIEWNLSDGNHNTAGMYKMNLRDYGYVAIDLDYGTDSYKVQIGYHVYYYNKDNCNIEPMYMTFDSATDEDIQSRIDENYATLKADIAKYQAQELLAGINAEDEQYKWTLEQAKATKTLAFVDGSHVYLVMRSMKTLGLAEYSSGNRADAYLDLYTCQDENGDWYLCNMKTYDESTSKVRVHDINDFKHITFVGKTTATSDTSGSYKFAVYVDGVFMYEKNFSSANYVALYLDSLRQDISNSAKTSDSYSYAFDNLTVNYYEKGYDSGTALGVDDLYDGANVNSDIRLYDLSDTVCSRSYAGANGKVTVGNNDIYLTSIVKEQLPYLSGDISCTSTMGLYDLVIPEAINSITITTEKTVTLAEESVDCFVLLKTADGYLIRRPSEKETATLEWYDVKGDLIISEKIVYGKTPDADSKNANCVDGADLYYGKDIVWQFDLDGDAGELDLYKTEAIRALTAAEYAFVNENMNGVIKIYPACSETVKVENITFYVGEYFDGNKTVRPVPASDGTFTAYQSFSSFIAEAKAAPDGATVVIVADDQEVGANQIVEFDAGKTVYIDLNGKTLLHTKQVASAEGNGNPLFRVNEGGAIYVYSSVAGGQVVQASYKKTDTTMAYSAGGMIEVKNGTDSCEVNVGAARGFDGDNFSYSGGTLVYVWGPKNTTLKNDKEITVNVDGGFYYAPLRSGYAIFTMLAPDVRINLKNAEFYVNFTTYGIFHDYGGDYCNRTYISASGCKFLAMSGTTDGAIFYTQEKESEAYFEDCTFIGKFANYINGKVTLGKGNVIATTFDVLSKCSFADGVYYAAADSVKLPVSYEVTHMPFYRRYLKDTLEDGTKVYEHTLTPTEDGSAYYLSADIYNAAPVTTTLNNNIKLVTFTADSVPESVASAVWQNPDGSAHATTYDFIGETVNLYSTDKLPKRELGNGWFDIGYASWSNATEGSAADSFVLKAGVNSFSPVPGLVADVDSAKAQLQISNIEFTFNLYVPVPAEDSGITFDPTTAGTATGFFSGSTKDNGLAGTRTIGGVKYYSYYNYLAHSDLVGREKIVKFTVSYDINGDGTVSDDEKNIPLEDRFNLNAIDYAMSVINIYPHGSDEANLMFEMIRYEEIFSRYTKANIAAAEEKLQAFYAACDAKCDCEGETCANMIDLDKLEIKNAESSVADLSKYVYGVSFSISTSTSKPRLVLYTLPLEEGCTLSIKGSFKKYNASGQLVDQGVSIVTSASYGTYKATVGESEIVCPIWRINGFDFAYMTDVLSIEVTHTNAAGVTDTVTGSYSLGAYITANGNLEVTRALYAFSLAAKDHRLITRDEVAEK